MKKYVTLTIAISAAILLANSQWKSEAATIAPPAGGAAIFNQNCVKCHGANGKGVENFTPDLSRVSNRGEWLGIINNGKGAMPGFKGSLKPAQVTAVLAHIRSLGKGGKKK